MELKTVNLELSKRLKEVGYPQEGFFWWVKIKDRIAIVPQCHLKMVEEGIFDGEGESKICVAPTVAELGERLPKDWHYDISHNDKNHFITGHKQGYGEHIFVGESEADARAKMYIYLKEKGLL